MANLSKFSERVSLAWEKAREIYSEMRKKGTHGRKAWGEAVRQAWRYVKSLVSGKVTYWTDEGEVKACEIEPISAEIEAIIKPIGDGLVWVWDRAKQCVISFYTFQIL